MKKKILMIVMMIICMIYLANFTTSAAANTIIGYPKESLYNKKDSNLVALESGMNLSGKTLYFNVDWKLSDYLPTGCQPDDVYTLTVTIKDEREQQNGELSFEITDDRFSNLKFNLDTLYYVPLEGNDWYMSSFTFPKSSYIVSADSLELTFSLYDGTSEIDDTVTIPLNDLVLVTKEEGQLISNDPVDDYGCKGDVDIMTILIYGALICMGIFIISHIKR